MLSKVKSCALHGIDGYIIEVEADVSQGLPSFSLVGLPESAVKESIERVRTSVRNSGYAFPVKKIIVNLAPADTKKVGPSYDLPIAIGILACENLFPAEAFQDYIILGELSLDGSLRHVNGILPMIYSCFQNGYQKFAVPYENANEAALVAGAEIYAVKNLNEIVLHFQGASSLSPYQLNKEPSKPTLEDQFFDFADVRGQENVKRAMEIAAAGMHNLLMIGPPGSGKTMMAQRLPTILPELNSDESLELTKIYSVAGLLKAKDSLIQRRPFRSPHHTISPSAMIGGGSIPHPGEVSLAHNAVLFLDELPEFPRNVLESLRQPLEDRKVTLSRVQGTFTYPADFMLVAAMNPCPCGYLGDPRRCHCTQNEISKYVGKISGPLMDRIDIQIETPAVNFSDLENKTPQEHSKEIKQRVIKAHELQLNRYKKEGIFFNSQLSSSQIERFCILGTKEKEILKAAFERLRLSARAYHKILKVSRTIADLDGDPTITIEHIAEAIQYRSLDRKYFSS